MSRWQAFGIHLTGSAILLLLLLLVIIWLWYPGILFNIDGGWTGLRIVIGVDLVLGPLLTLIVFKAGKPGLKFDLTAIVLFQLACMAGGMSVVYNERPLALVLAYDTIYSISAQELEEFDRDVSVLSDFPGAYPKLIYVELPEGEFAAEVAVLRSQVVGEPLYVQTELFRSLQADNINEAFRADALVRSMVENELQVSPPEACRVAKFVSVLTTGYVCFNAEELRLEEFYAAG